MKIESQLTILDLINTIELLEAVESRLLQMLPQIGDNAWCDLDGAKTAQLHDAFSSVLNFLYNELAIAEGRK